MRDRYIIVVSESRLEVHTGTDGLLSGLAHDHLICAEEFDGFIEFEPSVPEQSRVSIRLSTKALALRDSELKPKDRAEIMKNMRKSLECDRFPSISFLSQTATPVSGGFEIQGELRIKGRAKTLRTVVAFESDGDTITASGRFECLHSEFGMKPYSAAFGAIKVANKLSFEFQVFAKRTT